MVRRHWVRGHWRGWDKATASLAFVYCLIVAYAIIWIYDEAQKSWHATAIWWGIVTFVILSVIAAISAAVWLSIHRWREKIESDTIRQHRPRYASAHATNNVRVNVHVSPVSGSSEKTTRQEKPSQGKTNTPTNE